MEQNDNLNQQGVNPDGVNDPSTYEDAFGLNYAVYGERNDPEIDTNKGDKPTELINDLPSITGAKDVSAGNLILVGFVVVSGILSAINVVLWVLLAARPDYAVIYRILGPLLIIGEFILTAKTLTKFEAARTMCLFGTIALLIFSLFSTYDFIENYHNRNQMQQNIINQTEQTINTYKSDKLINSSEKSAIITELKATEATDLSKLSKKNTLLPIITIYILTFLPVIFLERPEAKEVFK